MGFNNIDLSLWKEIQNKLSRELGLAIWVVDSRGKEIVHSGELPFYAQLINSKRAGLLNKPNGMINIAKKLMLHGEEIGHVVCGPVGFDKEFDLKELADELFIGEDELIDASNEIEQIPQDRIDIYKKVISVFADLMPKITFKAYKKDKEITQLKALHNIIRKINSTLDLDEVLKYIMNFLVNSLNATDCSVFIHDEDGEKKYILKKEVEKMIQIEKKVSAKALEEKKPIIVKDIMERFRIDVDKDYNALLVVPLNMKEETVGTISLYDKSADLSEVDLDFISVISDQMAIAIANARRFGEVRELAVIDKLTGAYNRRYFIEKLEKALDQGLSVRNPLALVLLDVDNFGKYNNTHGHPRGDDLLKELSKILKKSVRDGDIVGRYGGEEFILMLPKATPQIALDVADRIKKAVEEFPFYGRETQPNGKVTVSIGLVVCRADISLKEFIKETDEALYRAKNSGKNKIVQKVILSNNLKAEI